MAEDGVDDLIDWDEIEKDQSEERIKSGVPIGSDIQRALRDECLMVSPYVRMEVGTGTRFDLVMFIPDGMPFIVDSPQYAHCWEKFRKIYCKRKWGDIQNNYRISFEEIEKRKKELREQHKEEQYFYPEVPTYRYKDKEYMIEEDFWRSNAKKELAMCDQMDCEWWNRIQKVHKEEREKYGFMDGLHIFEVKSDKDKHDLLIHQIPNMISIADYVWLVLGENQPIPEWLPPYVSVMRFKDGKFIIEHKNKLEITQPPTYKDAMKRQGYRVESKEEYSLHRLFRLWRINSMFHYQFEGQIIIDMEEEIDELMSFLERAKKYKNKNESEKFQRNLFDYDKPNADKGSSD